MTDALPPAFVLVRPQMAENVGAAARGMWNFGLDRLRLVAPRDGWPDPRAVAMASGAGRLLDQAQVFAGTAEAIADCTTIYATTARPRELTKRVLAPEAAMADAHGRTAHGERVAVLFGAERAGLDNADIARATAIVSVPVNPRFASLNLAQSVLLLAYEWRRQAEAVPQPPPGPAPATALEIEHLARRMERELEAADFFFPADKAASMKLALRNLWPRLGLTGGDVQMLHGIVRQLVRRRSG